MKCQILFSRKKKKNITSLSSAEIAHSVKERSAEDFMRDVFNNNYAICFFSDFLYKSVCCWYAYELPQLVSSEEYQEYMLL